jgi:CheY-like chemotaxis protein
MMSSAQLLVVDDSPTVRKLVELTLRTTPWTASFAANGAEAIRMARAQSPQAILLDVVLPDMQALDVCADLARSPQTEGIPIILMSAKDETCRRSFSRYSSVVDFIHKPFTPIDLAARIRTAFSREKVATSDPPVMAGRWPATEICSLIAHAGRTGQLDFKTERGSISVFFKGGKIVCVTSIDPKSGEPYCDPGGTLKSTGKRLLMEIIDADGEPPFEWRDRETLPSFVTEQRRSNAEDSGRRRCADGS